MNLLLDAMWPPLAASAIRRPGCDVASVADRKELRAFTDDEVWAVAVREGRVIVTSDIVDFRAMFAAATAAGRPRAPLILTPADVWLRGPCSIRASARLAGALDALLASGVPLEGEHWLLPAE